VTQKLFYCWQSDLPHETNKDFIQSALEEAVQRLTDNGTPMEVDRDVLNAPGSQAIFEIIREKIENASVFVCDLSAVGQYISKVSERKKHIPNANVLIEFGYALATVGDKQVIQVINKAYGDVTDMPSDIVSKFTVVYDYPEDITDSREIESIHQYLIEELIKRIPVIPKKLETNKLKHLTSEVVTAIENKDNSKDIKIRKYLPVLFRELESLNPQYTKEDNKDADLIIQSIQQSEDLLLSFIQVCEALHHSGDHKSAEIIYNKVFGFIAPKASNYERQYGIIRKTDFWHYIGGEFLLVFIAFMIKGFDEGKFYALIPKLLDTKFQAQNYPENSESFYVFNGVSQIWYLVAKHNYVGWVFEQYYTLYEQRFKETQEYNLTLKDINDAEIMLCIYYGLLYASANEKWILKTSKEHSVPEFIIKGYNFRYATYLQVLFKQNSIEVLQEEVSHLLANYRFNTHNHFLQKTMFQIELQIRKLGTGKL